MSECEILQFLEVMESDHASFNKSSSMELGWRICFLGASVLSINMMLDCFLFAVMLMCMSVDKLNSPCERRARHSIGMQTMVSKS